MRASPKTCRLAGRERNGVTDNSGPATWAAGEGDVRMARPAVFSFCRIGADRRSPDAKPAVTEDARRAGQPLRRSLTPLVGDRQRERARAAARAGHHGVGACRSPVPGRRRARPGGLRAAGLPAATPAGGRHGVRMARRRPGPLRLDRRPRSAAAGRLGRLPRGLSRARGARSGEAAGDRAVTLAVALGAGPAGGRRGGEDRAVARCRGRRADPRAARRASTCCSSSTSRASRTPARTRRTGSAPRRPPHGLGLHIYARCRGAGGRSRPGRDLVRPCGFA